MIEAGLPNPYIVVQHFAAAAAAADAEKYANPCAAEANTIQIYAWNEIAEGGWLLPSHPAVDSVATGRPDAIADILR